MGMQTLIDSADFFVQSRDIGTPALLNVTATATGTNVSADQQNTLQKGVCLYVNLTSVAATATLGINLQGKDPVSGNYALIARASLDAQATLAAASTSMVQVYPGLTTQASLSGGSAVLNAVLPMTWRIAVSITAIASGGGANVGYTVGQSRIL